MSLNGIEEFELVWGAVSTSTAETTRLQIGEHYWAAKETCSTGSDTVEVPILSPQAILDQTKPDVLICDIEGNEQGLIEGVDLSAVRSLIVEFHPDSYGMATMERLEAQLAMTGFRRLTEWTVSDRPQVHHYMRC